MTIGFDPRESDRFLCCCGGYRRWELVEGDGEWWWRLASDWGQAHIADMVVPTRARISLRVDISRNEANASPAHGSVSLCTRIEPGRLGIDGLPFQADVAIKVGMERGRIRLGGADVDGDFTWPLEEHQWGLGPVDLVLERNDAELIVFIGTEMIGTAKMVRARPSLLILSANSAGMAEAGTRFGFLTVQRLV